MTTPRDSRPPTPAPPGDPATADALDAGGRSGSGAARAPASGPVPEAEVLLDPRAIARASLQAGRNASLWWSSAGIALAAATSVLWSPRLGPAVLALLLLTGAVLRAVLPPPGPVAFSPRARWLDVVTLTGFAAALLGLTWIVPA